MPCRSFLFLCFLCAALIAKPCACASPHDACRATDIHVHGRSLSPLVDDGAVLKGFLGACPGHPQRGELVLFHTSIRADDPLIKIAVGLPGDHFALTPDNHDGWALLINGHLAKTSTGAPYSFTDKRSKMLALYAADYHGIIPPDAYLLLGDDPGGTIDSTKLGLIDRSDILGTAPLPHH